MTAGRTWIELSEEAFLNNFTQVRRVVGSSAIWGVVKANGYGHGLREIVSMAKKCRFWGLTVAYGDEALLVREAGYKGRIMVLSWWGKELKELVENQVEIVVYDLPTLEMAVRRAKASKRQLKVHLKVDCGTTRIGWTKRSLLSDRSDLFRMLRAPYISLESVWSHFSNSEEAASAVTISQLSKYEHLYSILGEQAKRHIASTAAALRYPSARFDMVRIGIGMYGIWPSDETREWARSKLPSIRLEPVLKWFSILSQIKEVEVGTRIGYGQTFRARRRMRIGIVPVGYSDGLARAAGNTGWAVVRGRRCRIIGRVSMNLCVIDLTGVSPRRGEWVTLIGKHVTVEDHAAWSATIPYEILTKLSTGLERRVTR